MKAIARRGIADRTPIARRQAATGGGQIANQEPYNFPPGTWNFTPPVAGYWKFVGWGVGGALVGHGGASGAYGEITRFLTPAQTVVVVVGAFLGVSTVDTTFTFPDGHVATAGQASGITAGVAAGFDVNLNGSAGTAGTSSSPGPNGGGTGGGSGGANSGTSDGGAGAPANLPYRGGAGGTNSGGGQAPGGGSSQGGSSVVAGGLALAAFIKP